MSAQLGASSHEQVGKRLMSGHALDNADVTWVARQFQIERPAEVSQFRHRGNINLHAFYVRDADGREFLLQRLNTDVFTKPDRVMAAMAAWSEAQENYIRTKGMPPGAVWEPVRLVRTLEGDWSLRIQTRRQTFVWRMMKLIPDSFTCRSLREAPEGLDTASLAEEVGRGLALACDLSSSMPTDGLESSLPGYRDTRGYYSQLHGVLRQTPNLSDVGDLLPEAEDVREATAHLHHLAHEVDEHRRRMAQPGVAELVDFAMESEASARLLQNEVEAGSIRRTAIHGDTKLENFLFCRNSQKVKSLVDLDTIMPYTWLADWGDMARSLCNIAGEMEPDPEAVQVSTEVYAAVAKGFITTAQETPAHEIALMPRAVEAIAIELGVRFLTDYLRGDNYFQLASGDPPDLNLIRGRGQLTLAKRLAEKRAWAEDFAHQLIS
jgi:hypothetical protein